MLEFGINDFIKKPFMQVICFGFGWLGFNYVSKLFVKCVKVCETKSFFYVKLLDWLIYKSTKKMMIDIFRMVLHLSNMIKKLKLS